jgi:hypothetical protein
LPPTNDVGIGGLILFPIGMLLGYKRRS